MSRSTHFRALQALDVPQRNGTHEALAALASARYVKAIVPTNFDRLIEGALPAVVADGDQSRKARLLAPGSS